MQLAYVVHSAAQEPVSIPAVAIGAHQGREVTAPVPGLVVELVGVDGAGHTFRFVPRDDVDLAEHLALFAPGQSIIVSFGRG